MPRLIESAVLQLRVAKRLAPRRGATLHERLGRLDDRLVFVVGSPRSGTTPGTGTVTPPADDTSGGTTAPEATPVPDYTATNDTPPEAGSAPEQFEDFCEQNAGAC